MTTTGAFMEGATRSQCFRKERLLVHFLSLEVCVEYHGSVANENAAERRDADFIAIEDHEPVVGQIGETREFRRKIFVEGDTEFSFDFALGDDGVAQQATDHGSAQEIVGGKLVTAHSGNATPRDGGFVL